MTSAIAPSSPVVLADRLARTGVVADVAWVTAGAAVTAVLAQVEVPLWPVPITGQTLAVVLVGATLGMRRGALSMLLYAVVGLLGLPVFSGATGGLAALATPSFGYVVGFIGSAALVGWLAERRWDRRFGLAAVASLAATALPFAVGLPWLAVVLGQLGLANDLGSVLQAGLYPFVVGGLVKALIAAGVLPLAWRALGRTGARD